MGQYDDMIAQAAGVYGADPGVLSGIAKLESGYNPGSMNNWDVNAKRGTPSGGMFQFIQPTYNAFSKQARAANPGAWQGVNNSWMDPHAQALTTAWAITHGHQGDWATYKRAQAYRGKGPKPSATLAPDAQLANPPRVGGSDPIIDAIMARDMSPAVAILLQQADAAPAAPVAGHPVVAASTPTPSGVGAYGGKKVAAWIQPILDWASQHGWHGAVTSGYRSLADQQRIYNSGVRPAAKPGTSNHEFTDFPGGAIDVSQAQQLANIIAGSPYAGKLVYAGAKDPVHFSHPHNGSY